MILFGDVIEHLPREDGRALLAAAVDLAQDAVVVRIPLGDGWRREGREAPDHHRSQWYAGDFARYACELREYDFFGNPYGLVTIDARPVSDATSQALLADVDGRLSRVEHRLERLVQP